jgi:hypothetical protein
MTEPAISASNNPFATRVDGEPPESAITRHMLVRGVFAAPVLLVIAGFVWGMDGAISSAYAVALILINLALAAALITFTARISLALMMGAVLFGYLIRLAIIFAAVILVRNMSWVSLPALGCTIVVTHLGLLFWEIRHVSATLTYPGLKPGSGGASAWPKSVSQHSPSSSN